MSSSKRDLKKSKKTAAIRSAMRAVWKLTMHVIKEYERKTGKKFPKGYDHNEYLGLVDDIYAGRRF